MRISDWSSDVCSSDLRVAIGYVVQDAIVEQHGILGNYAYVLAQAGLGQAANIRPIDLDGACRDIIETEHQARQGRFARTRRAPHRQRFACRYGQPCTKQNLALAFVTQLQQLQKNGKATGREKEGKEVET